MITLRDLWTCGNDLLLPKEPVAPFRYVERLVNRAAARKHPGGDVLEIGPGSETMLRYICPASFHSVTIIDYDPIALHRAFEQLEGIRVRSVRCDVTEAHCLDQPEAYDLVIANAIVEHLKDDADFVGRVYSALSSGGTALCTTVLGPARYNLWDHAVGHYRRYTPDRLRELFSAFSTVQIIQTSLIQELARPLFFGRIRHLAHNTLEENNRRFSQEHASLGKPPFASLFGLMRPILPVYLLIDWMLKDIQGGIAIVIAEK